MKGHTDTQTHRHTDKNPYYFVVLIHTYYRHTQKRGSQVHQRNVMRKKVVKHQISRNLKVIIQVPRPPSKEV